SKREQRSPQFGFPNEGFLEDEYDGEPYPQPYPEGGAGESFASASSGSNKGPFTEGQSQANAQAGNFNAGGNPYTEGQSQSNAQSASFNFGPYSASFSVAESSSGGPKF
ncbi:hypothetical protein WH47_06028, partial [Habropoda laboriosa]